MDCRLLLERIMWMQSEFCSCIMHYFLLFFFYFFLSIDRKIFTKYYCQTIQIHTNMGFPSFFLFVFPCYQCHAIWVFEKFCIWREVMSMVAKIKKKKKTSLKTLPRYDYLALWWDMRWGTSSNCTLLQGKN